MSSDTTMIVAIFVFATLFFYFRFLLVYFITNFVWME